MSRWVEGYVVEVVLCDQEGFSYFSADSSI